MVRQTSGNGSQDASSRTQDDEEVERLVQALAADGVGLLKEARRLALIERERLRLAVERWVGLLVLLVAGSAVGSVVAVAAGLRVLDGLSGGVDAAVDSPWAADIAAGVLGLVAITLTAWAVWSLRSRLRLAALHHKLHAKRAA